MSKATLAVLINGGTDNWSPQRWKERFTAVCKDRPVVLSPGDTYRGEDVGFAAVWKPAPGALAAFPNLRAIFNLGAGVDALIADSSLPKVPIIRVAIGDLTGRMTEYVVMHVLMHHRQQPYLSRSQQHKIWEPKHQWAASEISVGIMGLGTLGRDAADVLRRLGFRVAGWSASPKDLSGVECFSGQTGLKAFLARTNILVCLLPLTPDTQHILDRNVFAQLDRSSPLGAPVLINAGRGGLQVEADILHCLDDGTLGAVSLDVFETEPLPGQSPFWSHPKVIVSPHNAADTDPTEISAYVARQIEQLESGRPLDNAVDLGRGY
jgi:glyoxylate/hydroxypyruvate reductase A